MRRAAFIITFGDDFVHFLFDAWNEAAQALVAEGHAAMGEYGLLIDEMYNIELVTVH